MGRLTMVDTPGTDATVTRMNSTLVIVIVLVALLLTVGFATTLMLRRKVVRRAEGIANDEGARLRGQLVEHLERKARKEAGRPAGVRRDGEEIDEGAGKALDRVGRVAEAYANGEIDERMVGAAARMLGIDKQEALKRLESAGAAAGSVSTPGRRPVDRAKKRKKNKQAKRSRQANRR